MKKLKNLIPIDSNNISMIRLIIEDESVDFTKWRIISNYLWLFDNSHRVCYTIPMDSEIDTIDDNKSVIHIIYDNINIINDISIEIYYGGAAI